IVRDVVERLAHCFQGHAVLAGELLGRVGVGAVNGFMNNRRADATTLEEELAIAGARPWLEMLVVRDGRSCHDRSPWISDDSTPEPCGKEAQPRLHSNECVLYGRSRTAKPTLGSERWLLSISYPKANVADAAPAYGLPVSAVVESTIPPP